MMETLADLSVAGKVTTLRSLVEERLRSAITDGLFKPGQRLIERELCEMTGVGRTSIREALRRLEADGLVTTVPHRGPVVSTISVAEAEQLYELRKLLEGFAGRECAKNTNPTTVARLRAPVEQMRLAAERDDRRAFLAAKTDFYAALLDGCRNVFVQRTLDVLLNRVTLLRMTSMTNAGRIRHSVAEIEVILQAIEAGDPPAAEQACVAHVANAAAAALEILRKQANTAVETGAK
jgi:DNA-binding GntR family transcriptional regulator